MARCQRAAVLQSMGGNGTASSDYRQCIHVGNFIDTS